MPKKLKPAELLEKALAENNMELVKEAQLLLKAKPKPKKKKVVAKVTVKTAKQPKFKNDAEYFAYLAKLEEDHRNNVISGKAGALGSNSLDVADCTKACAEDAELDEKMGKKKRTRQ